LREFVFLPLGVLLYAVALHWVYANLVTETFSYLGYRYSKPAPEIMVFLWFAVVALVIALPRRLTRPSSVVLWILFVVTVAPGMLMAPYTSFLDDGQAVILALVLGATFFGVTLGVKRRTPIKPFKLHVSATTFWIIIAIFSAVTYGILLVTQGLSLEFVGILDVYDVRVEYSAGLEGVGILSYLVSTQANVVNPIIIARGIYSKRWHFIVLGILGQALLFSGTGFKTILFSVPALLIVAYVFRRNLRPNSIIFLWGATLMMVGAAVLDFIQDSIIWTSLFSRRFLLTPGMLLSAYVAFYGVNPQAHLGHSVLSPWIDYKYDLTPPRLIGSWLANSPNTAMNANLFADGFANFGWMGLVGAGVVLLVFLRILDRAAHGVPTAVSALVMIMPTIALSNASVLTSMFSHGLVVAVVLLAIMPRNGWGKRPSKFKTARRTRQARFAKLSRPTSQRRMERVR
jgi:hypothetical protein